MLKQIPNQTFVFKKDLMNREKEDQLPMMQVGFIDSICLPIYEVIFLNTNNLANTQTKMIFYIKLGSANFFNLNFVTGLFNTLRQIKSSCEWSSSK